MNEDNERSQVIRNNDDEHDEHDDIVIQDHTVIRMCHNDGSINGCGILDTGPTRFRFPEVGEAFERTGPELVRIVDDSPLSCDLQDEHGTRHLNHEGIHGDVTGGGCWISRVFYHSIAIYRGAGYSTWLALTVADGDLVHDKRHTVKARAKRGTVAYRGNLAGLAAYLRKIDPELDPPSAWDEQASPYPRDPWLAPVHRDPSPTLERVWDADRFQWAVERTTLTTDHEGRVTSIKVERV